MRILSSQVALAAVGVVLLATLLLMAGCAMDKFKMSFEKGVINPRAASAATASTPSVESAVSNTVNEAEN